MCPVCLANMALVASGATSTAGVTALFTRKLYSRMATNNAGTKPKSKEKHDEPGK